MDDKKLEKIMADWAIREEKAAPLLEPPEELRRRVLEKRKKNLKRPLSMVIRFTAAAACLIAFTVLLRILFLPSIPQPEREHLRLMTWQAGSEKGILIKGPTLGGEKRQGGPEKGAKGPGKGQKKGGSAFFTQLLFQYHREGSQTITGVDLLSHAAGKILLETEDRFRLGLLPASNAYFYIFLLDSRAGVEKLFPDDKNSSASNPLIRGQAFYLPAEPGWFSLADKRGEERVYVVASQQQQPLLEELFNLCEEAQEETETEEHVARLRSRLESLHSEGRGAVEVIVFSFNGP